MPRIPISPASAAMVDAAEEIVFKREEQDLQQRLEKAQANDLKVTIPPERQAAIDKLGEVGGLPGMPARRQAGESDQPVPSYTRAFGTPEEAMGEPSPTLDPKDGVGGPQESGGLSEADIIELRQYRDQRKTAQDQANTRSMLLEPGNPDQAAEDHQLAQGAGVQPVQVEQDRDTFRAAERAKQIDALEFTAPKVKSWISDPANFRVAHDDTEHLAWWETIGQKLDALGPLREVVAGAPGRSLAYLKTPEGLKTAGEIFRGAPGALESGVHRIDSGIYGLIRAPLEGNEAFARWLAGDASVEAMNQAIGGGPVKWFTDLQEHQRAAAETSMPQSNDPTVRGALSGIQSLPASGLAILASLMSGGVAPALMVMGGTVAGDEYGSGREQGLGVLPSAGYGTGQGLIEMATELLPMKWLVGDLAKRTPFVQTLLKNTVAEAGTEEVATASQDFLSWAILPENADKPFSAYVAERGPAAYETLIAAFIGSGVQTTLAKAGDETMRALSAGYQERRAKELETTFKAMAQGAKDSKLLTRLPDKYREAVASVTKDGPLASVRIGSEAVNEFAQANNLTPGKLAQAFRIDPDEMIAAIQSGDDIVIPAGNYAAALGTAKKELGISGEAIHTAFAPNMRLRADDFTAKEHEAMQAVFEQEQKAQAETGTKEQGFADSADRVREAIREQVSATKLFDTETANTQAAIAGEMVVTLAERTGQDPETLWKEMGFDVVAALSGEEDAAAFAQANARQAIQVEDPIIERASKALTEYEFLVWKAATLEGKTNQQIADNPDIAEARKLQATHEKDMMPSLNSVGVILNKARGLDLPVPKAKSGKPETVRGDIERLLKQGLTSAQINEQLGRGQDKLGSTYSQVSKIKRVMQAEREKALAQSNASDKSLYVVHNLTEQNLIHADEIGGLAAPSLAIANIDKGALTNFGDISLIATPDFLGTSKIKTFDADIYSPRHPRPVHDIDDKAASALIKELRAETADLGDLRDIDLDGLHKDGPSSLLRNEMVKAAFFKSRGELPKNLPRKKFPENADVATKAAAKLDVMDKEMWDVREDARVKELAAEHYRDTLEKLRSVDPELADDLAGKWFYADEEDASRIILHPNQLQRFIFEAKAYRKAAAREVDTIELGSMLSKKLRSPKVNQAFEEYVEDLAKRVITGKSLFKGFTNAGNRRYGDYTMETILREMTRELQGGEGWNYGAGSVRSKYARELKSISAIRARKGQLVSDKEMEAAKKEGQDGLVALLNYLRPFYRFGGGNQFIQMDDMSLAIGEGPKGIREAFDFGEDPEPMRRIREFIDLLTNLPTEYFEAKAQRAVDISEFVAAIVPRGISPKALDILKNAGLEIRYYKRNDAEDRARAIRGVSDVLFQGDMRGSFTPRTDRSVIRLFESSNLSTFVHEASHWYLDTLWKMAQTETPHPFVQEQLAAVLEWKGKSPNWTNMFDANGVVTEEGRELHESFAETFEAYLREGKAPSTSLRSVFATLKQWLLRIYKSLSQIGQRVNLNDEIRAVFDRALASEGAIAAATAVQTRTSEQMAQALLDKGVITEKAFERTKARLLAARERAEADLMARLMEDYERNQKAWWRSEERQVRAEVTSDVDERPEQRAFQWLSGGGWRSTQADVVEAAAEQADGMALLSLAQADGYQGVEPAEATEWLAARRKGLDLSDEARMARAKEQGFKTKAFHETTEEASRNLTEGFDLSRRRAAKGDHVMPIGIFTKPGEGAIGIGKVQLPVMLRLGNTRSFADRAELEQHLSQDSQYAALAAKVRGADAAFKKQFEETEAAWDAAERLSPDWHRLNDVLTNIQREWEAEMNRLGESARSRATEVLKDEGLNSVTVLKDIGSFKRAIKTTVIFDPKDIRSESAAFDPDNAESSNFFAQTVYDLNTPEARAEWVRTSTVSEVVPGEMTDSRQYGFMLDDKTGVVLSIAYEADGAASVEWTFLNRLADRVDITDIYKHGKEEMSPAQLKALLARITAIMEADVAEFERDAYSFMPASDAHAKIYARLLKQAGGHSYEVVTDGDASFVFLVHKQAGMTADGKITPRPENKDRPVEWDSSEDLEERADAFYERVKALGRPAGAVPARQAGTGNDRAGAGNSPLAYVDADATTASIQLLQARMIADNRIPAILLFRTDTGRVIAFSGEDVGYSHDAARRTLGLGNIKLSHGVWNPRKWPTLAAMNAAGADAWYGTTGSTADNGVGSQAFAQSKSSLPMDEGRGFNTNEVLYHGGRIGDAPTFDKAMEGKGAGGEGGVWFTPNSKLASAFGPTSTYNVRGKLLTLDAGGASVKDANIKAAIAQARKRGYDGIRFKNLWETHQYHGDPSIDPFHGERFSDQVVIFDPKNIRRTNAEAKAPLPMDEGAQRQTFEIEIKLDHPNARATSTTVVRNPSKADLNRLSVPPRESGLPRDDYAEIRGYRGDDGNLYVASGYDAEHYGLAGGLQRKGIEVSADNRILISREGNGFKIFSKSGDGLFEWRPFDPSQEGSSKILAQSGDNKTRTAPPPSLPPMRLNLEAVREQYGEEALNSLPPQVRAYAAAATDADQFIQIARDVKRTLNQKRPKSLTKFLSTHRRIGQGNDRIAYAGIRDEGEEIKSIIGAKKAAPGLIADPKKDSKTVRSYSIEQAAQAAWEEGYFNEESPPGPREFLDALANDVQGITPVYSRNDIGAVQEISAAEQWEAWFDAQGIDISATVPELRAKLEEALSGQAENAIGPDEAAQFFNMPDGAALLQGLKQGPLRDQIIRELTRQRMTARHGDPFRDGTIMQEAEKFARNEVQQRQFEIELEALAKAAGQQFAGNLAKQTAIENLRTKQVREVLNYNQWLILEQRWGKKALEAATKGKFDEAAEYARYRLVNFHMFREGRKLAEDIEKTRKHLLDYGKKTKIARLYAAGEDYADQMAGLLDDYQLRPETRRAERNRASRAQWIQAQMAAIDPFAAYQDSTKTAEEQRVAAAEALERSQALARLAEGAEARNYKSLTVEELLGVRAEADMIWKLATLKDRLIKDGERRRLSLAAEDIAAEVIANQPNPKGPEPLETDTPGEVVKSSVQKYFAMHRTLQSLAHQFAGGKEGGVFWRYIVRPLNEAFARLSGLRKQMGDDVAKLFGTYTKAEQERFYRDRRHFAGIGRSLTTQGRLAIALNWGNEKNRRRIMDAYGWDEAQVQEVLDTLTKRDWDWVQSVWDYLDTWFPEASRVHESVHGAPMDKVEPLQVATRFGIYRGGYYPIKFDPKLSSKAGQRAVEAEQRGAVPKVGQRAKEGFTQKRAEGKVTLPLRLSAIDVITQHLDEVARSIATEETLYDVGRIVKWKEVEDTIVGRHGRQIYNTIVNQIVTAKFGMEGTNGILAHLRNGATVVGLSWKAATAALQMLGVSNSIVRVGGPWVAKGYARVSANPVSASDEAQAKSEFMRHRRQNQSPEQASLMDAVKNKWTPSFLSQHVPGFRQLRTAHNFMVRNGFALMANVQYASVDLPTWWGGYYKARNAGAEEADAIALADQSVIDAQGGGELHQLAAMQSGAGTKYAALLRILTNFMSYMITTYNLGVQRVRNARTGGQIMALGLDMILLAAVPVAGKMLLDAITRGIGADDEPEDWLERYLREQIAFLAGPFVGVSQFAGSARGDDSYGYKGPAGLAIFNELNQIGAAAAEADFDASFWKPANRAAGMIFHYPAGQVQASVLGAQAYFNGETDNPAAIFFGPPPAN